jgi:Tfp pilus assembly protein PilO
MKKLCITLFAILLIALVGCGVFWMIIIRTVQSVYTAEARALEAKAEQQEEQTVKKMMQEIGPDIETLKTRVIGSNGTVAFISSVESLARAAGVQVTINAVEVKEADLEKEKFEQLALSINSEGTWKQVHTFLSMLESMPYKLRIETMNLTQNLYTEPRASSTPSTVIVWTGETSIKVLKRK